MIRITLTTFALCALTLPALAAGDSPWNSYPGGDVNCDMMVNVQDVVATVNAVLDPDVTLTPCGVECAAGESYCGPGTAWTVLDIEEDEGVVESCRPSDAFYQDIHESSYAEGYAAGQEAIHPCEGDDVEWKWVSNLIVIDLAGAGTGSAIVDPAPVVGSWQCVPSTAALESAYEEGAASVDACEGADVELVWHSDIFVPFDGMGATSVPILPIGYTTCEPKASVLESEFNAGVDSVECAPGEDFCGDGTEWQEDSVVCCMAMTASCLACMDGVTVEEYCALNLGTMGCVGDGFSDPVFIDNSALLDTNGIIGGMPSSDSGSCQPTDAYTDAHIDIGYADGQQAGYDTGYAAGELSVECGVCPTCGEADACGVLSLYEDECGICGGDDSTCTCQYDDIDDYSAANACVESEECCVAASPYWGVAYAADWGDCNVVDNYEYLEYFGAPICTD